MAVNTVKIGNLYVRFLKDIFFELSATDQGEFWKQVGMHRRAWTPAYLSFHDKDTGFEGD